MEFHGISWYLRDGCVRILSTRAHHVIEQRFGLNITDIVAVTNTEHQAFTNAWRSAFKFGTDYSTINKTVAYALPCNHLRPGC